MNRKLITGWLLIVLGLGQAGGGVLLAAAARAEDAALADPNLVRIHVIAHSDSPEEQALKLAVRDAVLDRLRPALSGARSRAEAEARIAVLLPELEQAARAVAAAWGAAHPVRAELGTYAFPGKGYGDLYLPAGRYRALRILIGDAAGANFWCLVYPSFCYTIREVQVPPTEAVGTTLPEGCADGCAGSCTGRYPEPWAEGCPGICTAGCVSPL
ncbi:stage II sporulation protein R [Symbiobacterium thermophilum]|uniref:Pro-sigma-E processing factor SpoIIR n=1 Tax=Symbiobacterium thermophilum (strain DSM 24528 / JCM 14929 / IAM 14863 / T) TaxID=292459 RepID=Q67Q35_SYMTH|nr:stage II sporulation protein R [Symbiobacterium thermophilum]BAD40208.1 pro-sigma-E processing factor SpoIIR [Symbiobacterium thermophilum IAM 14863]